MKHISKIIIGILGLIILLSVVAILFIANHKSSGGQTAIIKVDGKVVKSIDLSTITDPVTFTVENGRGGINTIQAENGKIAITHANCPDQLCVERGFITNSLLPTVCLPNGVVVQIENTAIDQPLDAIAE